LRIPDDDITYPLPPGLGTFPLKHVDDHPVPPDWSKHGGVMLPMYQSEALWLNFRPHDISDRRTSYPFAVKVAAGKIDALTGSPWHDTLEKDPQDYMVSTEQPWLDGYCVEKDRVRQFVAMPLGSGYSAEEQITGQTPPTVPFTAREYTEHHLPWFEYYNDHSPSIPGSLILKNLKSVIQKAREKGENPLPENQTVTPGNIKQILHRNRVREGEF
jgi:hypothetical protein